MKLDYDKDCNQQMCNKNSEFNLMIVAFTVGGFMWTLSLPPTSRRTVAVKRESFFNTCGGCFSIMNVLQHI